MDYITLPGTAVSLPRLILGTDRVDRTASHWPRIFDHALALGVRAFDTAVSYSAGDSEHVLGEWIKARGVRKEICVISKGCLTAADGRRRVGAEFLREDLERSLHQLGTDYLDVFLLHEDDPDTAVEPLVDAWDSMVRTGKTRAIGAANWRHQRVAEANAYAKRSGKVPLSLVSVEFSLLVARQSADSRMVSIAGRQASEAREFYRKQNLAVLAYSALGHGAFGSHPYPWRKLLSPYWLRRYASWENRRRLSRAWKLATEKKCTPAQVGLSYVLSQPFPTAAIVGCRQENHLAENAALIAALPLEERCWLDSELNSNTKNIHPNLQSQ